MSFSDTGFEMLPPDGAILIISEYKTLKGPIKMITNGQYSLPLAVKGDSRKTVKLISGLPQLEQASIVQVGKQHDTLTTCMFFVQVDKVLNQMFLICVAFNGDL